MLSRLTVIGLLVGGCASPTARPTATSASVDEPPPTLDAAEEAPVELTLPDDVMLSGLVEWLRAALAQSIAGRECMLAWGDVSGGSAVSLTWTGGALQGRVLCGDEVEAAMTGPRIRQVALLGWRRGRLRASHPSDTSTSDPLPVPNEDAIRDAESFPTYGFFDATVVGYDTAASVVLTHMSRRAVPVLSFILLPVS